MPAAITIGRSSMDARAYRLPWPPGVCLFELDRPEIFAHKARLLTGAPPRCERHEIAVDLRDDWPGALRRAGFVRAEPTLFLVEGLLIYLEQRSVTGLLAHIEDLAHPGSTVLFDVVTATFFDSPYTKEQLERMRAIGPPFVFGTDEPEALLEPRIWDVTVTMPSDVGLALGRWHAPTFPRRTPGVPDGFLVEGTKRTPAGGP